MGNAVSAISGAVDIVYYVDSLHKGYTQIHCAHSFLFISLRHIFHILANQCVEEAS